MARIELTREMQAEGLNLEAIRRMLESVNGSAEAIFDFTRALRAPFEDEAPEIVEGTSWPSSGRRRSNKERLRDAGTRKARDPPLLPDGKVEVISPRMMQAAAALAELGISPEAALGVRRN